MGVNQELVSNQHSVGQNCVHLTWTPKFRNPVAKHEFVWQQLIAAVRVVARRHGIRIIELRILPDHVHCFVHIPARMSVSECVRILKGGSAHQFRRTSPFYKKFNALWSRGYFYRTVGAVTGAVVENYIKHSQGPQAYWKQKTLE